MSVLVDRSKCLCKFESVTRWLNYVSAGRFGEAGNTRRGYLYFLEVFCSYVGLNPDELIAERMKQVKSDNEVERRHHEEKTMSFIIYLSQEKKLAPGSVGVAVNAVRSFYKYNYSPLVIKSPRSWKTHEKRPPTKDELRVLVKGASTPMHRAIILFQAQTGISISDTLQVTYAQIADQLKAGISPVYLSGLRQKTNVPYETFFGKEASDALNEYLKTRPTLKNSDVLFSCSSRNVNLFLEVLSNNAGFEQTFSVHTLRKYFTTQLKMAQCNNDLVEYWSAHKLAGPRGSYLIPSVEAQRIVYAQFEYALSLEEKPSTTVKELISKFGGKEQLLKLISEAK